MKLYDNILIVTDFNETSLNLCLRSYKHLFSKNSSLHLLNVVEDNGFFSRLFASYNNTLEDCVKSKFPLIKESIKNSFGIDIIPHVKKGNISKEIVNFCKEENIDLIILLVSNEESTEVIGANTHKLLRLTHIPILALKQSYQEKEIKNILIPLELYLSSRQKVADAIAWAKHFNAKITICSGIWDKEKEIIFRVNKIGENVKEFIKSKDIDCDWVIFENLHSSKDFTEKIINYANSSNTNIDIVMVMNKDESEEFRIDDRGREIIRLSRTPVLCIPLKKTGMSANFL
ncbi:MAG: universal stress protein [Bacteroidales bacterium]|nr:universal stress protein [Bacteroidales bacterium]